MNGLREPASVNIVSPNQGEPVWRRHLPLLVVLLLAMSLLALGLAAPGIAEDSDAHRVLLRALVWPTRGYLASRSWGFPLFELYTYPLIVNCGELVARLPAAGFGLATLVLVYRHCLPSRGPVAAALIAAAVLVTPTIHLPATELMETSLALFLGLAFVLTVLRWRAVSQVPAMRELALLALLAALATAARPDNIIPVLAFGLAVMVRMRRASLPLLLAGLLYILVVLALFIGIYGPREMMRIVNFGFDVVLPDPWTRKVPRAVLGFLAAVGLPFVAFLALAGWRGYLRAAALATGGEGLFLVLGALLYIMRFTVLPDEVAYLTVPVATLVIIVCLALPRGAGHQWLFAALAALALPNLVQLSLFERPQARLLFRPSLQPGAIHQDLGYRRVYTTEWQFLTGLRRDPGRLGCARIADRSYPNPQPGTCLVMNRASMRYLFADRGGADNWVAGLPQFERIYVYDGATGRGWHQFMAYEDLPLLSFDTLHATGAESLLREMNMSPGGGDLAAPAT